MPDFVGPEFEIMLHRHDFCFYEVSLQIARGADPFLLVAVMLTSLSRGFAQGLEAVPAPGTCKQTRRRRTRSVTGR